MLQLALDTGATGTMINVGPLAAVGYDPSLQTERIQVTTGSGVEYAPRISVVRMRAIGHERTDFPVLAHTLPPSTSIDGILGLDYLRGARLSIDFRTGLLALTDIDSTWAGPLRRGVGRSHRRRQYMEMAPRLAVWPGVALTLVVYCLNMVGDALRDLLDPRLRGGGGVAGGVRARRRARLQGPAKAGTIALSCRVT